MGISTVLIDENGGELASIEDPTNVLHRLLPPAGDNRCQYISMIDWYGDTVFNYLQMEQFLREWDTLKPPTDEAEAWRVLRGIRELAVRVRGQRHAYLKFYGD